MADTSKGATNLRAAVRDYVHAVQSNHARRRGTAELSSRADLENLLNAIGKTLDPPIEATAELRDTGAGRPDFGLYDVRNDDPHAVVEVRGPDEDVPDTADGRQVAKYWRHYGVVLVTNYRDFLLVTRQGNGTATARGEGCCTLAPEASCAERQTGHPGAIRHRCQRPCSRR